MINPQHVPLSDPDKAAVLEWVNHPSRIIYQRVLLSQAAECSALAGNLKVANEPNADLDANELYEKARVLVASAKLFDEVTDKNSTKLYLVDLKPEPPINT